MEINKSVTIECEAQELWRWLTEFDKMKKWNKSVIKEEHVSSGEVREGFTTKLLIKEGKKEVWYENQVLNYNPCQYLRISLKGGGLGKNPMNVSYELIRKNNTTALNYKCTWKPAGFILTLFHPLIKKSSHS